MPDIPLIVPTALTNGSLHFAEVPTAATAQDVINALVPLDIVRLESLGDLKEHGWALQRIRSEQNGRKWEEEELEALGDGIVAPTLPVAPLVNDPSRDTDPRRHFSSFPMTSHLHSPVLRLVSLHPRLHITFTFARVPEIHDDFEWKVFISKTTTVNDVIALTTSELGLVKSLPIPGSANLEYVLEEVWVDASSEKSAKIPSHNLVYNVIDAPFAANPFSRRAKRCFRFCVPEEWYRRSKARTLSTTSIAPSETTIRRLAALEESEEEGGEDEGTAKRHEPSRAQNSGATITSDWRATLSPNRLSSFFDGWMRSPPPTSPTRVSAIAVSDRKGVSEPKLVEHQATNSSAPADAIQDEFDAADFEKMVDDLGLKGKQRTAMFEMSPDRKRYLLQQNRQMMAAKDPPSSRQNTSQPAYAASYGPSSAAALLPRLVPQLTGDAGLMRRISVVGWGASTAASPPVSETSSSRSSAELEPSSENGHQLVDNAVEDIQPLRPQITGGWTSWWASSGGEKVSNSFKEIEHNPKWYVDGIRSYKATDVKLAKHLISLRVHLSTAKLVWIQEFMDKEQGLHALNGLLGSLVGKGGKKKDLTDVQISVLLGIMKCLRVLLNTEPGFDQVLSTPTVITHIAYSLNVSSLKLRTLASELLAAICILSPSEGHKAVLSAMSDYRITFEESFRFETLVHSLRLPDMSDTSTEDGTESGEEEEGIWEARTASMSLVNALTNYPESLEERILLREEFGRRGLNEAIVALRYVKPPDSLTTQLDVYTEEKFEDEEDMRERARTLVTQMTPGHERSRSDSEVALEDLVRLAKQHGELYPMMVEILSHYTQILHRDIGIQLKADLFTILDRFVEQAALLDNFDDSWHVFLKRFAASVQHITGQELEVKAASDSDSLIEQELEALRSKVEELSDERAELRNKLNQQVAEMNTLKSLPLPLPVPNSKSIGKAGQENFHGLVQRLVLKEKQVLQLQAEVDRFKAQNPNEGRDTDERAKRDRDRAKWNTLMEEIAKFKKKTSDLENLLGVKDKEILYLKRALESVYIRFLSREEDRQESREAEIDAELMAMRTIETMTQKDALIASLSAEVAELKAQQLTHPKFANEKDFKAKSPPPPPPPKPKRSITAVQSIASTSAEVSPSTVSHDEADPSFPFPPAPPRPPPAPPAPPLRRSNPGTEISKAGISAQSSFPPAAPPPPPTTLSPDSPTSPPPAPPAPPLLSPLRTSRSDSTVPSSPPPLPPGPSAFKTTVKPKTSRPTKKLKPFFWNKLNSGTSSTVWNDVPSHISFNMDDLEATFTIDNLPTNSKLAVNPMKKQNVTTLLDISRANHVAIMLSRIKLSFSDIRKALLELDDNRLNIDNLKAISKQLPTFEEIGRIKDFGDVSKLATADQFFSHIMTLPRLSERLECMLYRRKLDLDITEIRPDLNTLRSASHELRSSIKFKQILQVVLVVGNTLNNSTFRGGARGFQLDALLKMKETKTAKGSKECPTLLHYIARVLMRTDPNLINFMDDMPHLEGAARVSVQTVTQSINGLAAGLSQVKEEIKQLKKLRTLSANDQFVHVMQDFVDSVEPSVLALKKMSAAVEEELQSLLLYFGEQPDSSETCKPEDFFGLILTFSSSLQKCGLEVNDAEEKPRIPPPEVAVEPPEESSAVPTIKAGDAATPQDASQGRAAVRSIRRGDYDQAIRSMRDGRRRHRPNRPLSKIFLDGGRPQSRVFD